jgi:V/A-type H+-transporting ATPase subunit I
MFRPQAMSKVELAVPERDVVSVTEALAASGAFHPTLAGHLGGERVPRYAGDWSEQAATFAELERRILAVMEALGVDEGPPPVETPHLIELEMAQMDIERLEREAQAPVQELEEGQRKLAQLQRYLSQLEPIADLEVALDTLRSLRYTFVLPGTMPTANLERLQTSLEFIPSVLVTLRREDHLATVVLFGTQRDADILNRAARSAYLNPLELPETYRGTPAEAIAALKSSIERTRQYIAECQTTIDYLHETRIHRLRHLLWRVHASRTLAETIARYGRLRYTYLVAGWVPTSQVPTLEQKIKQVSGKVLIEVSTPRRQDEAQVPAALENPPLLRAFQGLVTNYGHPRYSEMDPTPVLALTFSLVFGIMFGDVGHGLMLTLLGLLLASRKVRALRGFSGMGAVVITCGAMATLFGFLYGSIFGFEEVLEPLWIRPLEDIMDILLVTIAIGVGLLSLGMVCNVINAALARRWGHLLFHHSGLAGLIFYWSLIGLATGAFVGDLPLSPIPLAALAAVSGLAMTFSEVLEHLVEGHRPLVEGGFGTYLMQALFELFEMVIGLLSNTLSYVRMGAFAVAHGALNMVVFIMAEIVSPAHGVGYWIVLAMGNLFVIGFEGMIVGIQTLRLEYYEFFSKFFSGGGLRYRPLTLVSRGGE